MTRLRFSCVLPPSGDVPALAKLAEELGYDGFFLYDSPALYGDVWMSLARAAEVTSRIKAIEAERPEGQRHLAVHEGHLVAISDRDRPLLDAAGPMVASVGWTGTAETIAERMRSAGQQGVTEVVMAMAGPDLPRELRAFARAAGLGRA